MITREEIIRGLKIERECVSRDCDRDCANCDIVQEKEWLLSVYDGAIKLLENTGKRTRKEKDCCYCKYVVKKSWEEPCLTCGILQKNFVERT